LFTGLCKAELISEDNAEDPKKVGWMRACRTDKGVHAAGQVVSLKILLKDSQAADGGAVCEEKDLMRRLTEEINQHLPDQIRLFGIKRTVGSFHAKERTDSRFYEYLMPTYVLRPIDPEIYKPTSTTEKVQTTEEITPVKDGEAVGSDAEEPVETQKEGRWEFVESEITEEERNACQAYRVTSELLQKTKDMLARYCGSHSFHNFTVRMSSGDLSAKRFIIGVEVGEPFVRGGLEWVSVRFHGQSFMLHQIRKMVGLVVMAVRLGVGPEIVNRCYEPAKVNIPRAPALGLLLDKAIFTQYNERNPECDPLDFGEFEAERQRLKDEFIYPGIFGEEREFARFWGWLKCNDDHAPEFSFLLA
jgi:tRNA pseudouridine38-40 synthase